MIKKKPKVDLLEVYNSSDKSDLLNVKNLNKKIIPEDWIIDEDGLFDFSNDFTNIDKDEQKQMESELNKKLENVKEETENNDEPDFDWDDI